MHSFSVFHSFSHRSSVAVIFTFLIATSLFVVLSIARYTSPKLLHLNHSFLLIPCTQLFQYNISALLIQIHHITSNKKHNCENKPHSLSPYSHPYSIIDSNPITFHQYPHPSPRTFTPPSHLPLLTLLLTPTHSNPSFSPFHKIPPISAIPFTPFLLNISAIVRSLSLSLAFPYSPPTRETGGFDVVVVSQWFQDIALAMPTSNVRNENVFTTLHLFHVALFLLNWSLAR